MKASDLALLDTNILVYAADTESPFHERAKQLRDRAIRGELRACVSPQVLLEFFAVVTTPARVRNPRTPEDATLEIEKYMSSERILKIHPGSDIMQSVIVLLKKYGIARQQVFDLYLVATMLSSNVTRIYTYNRDDFSRFEELEVLTP